MLRIPSELHAALKAAAETAGLSLNEYCARKLAAPGDPPSGPSEGAIRRAVGTFGEHLVGVVAFGSWARDELTESSDVDLLVVLDGSVAITRGLYRDWDAAPLRWDGHAVEPHFAHLPGEEARIMGLWAEVATEGIVLVERHHEVSRFLARTRRHILETPLERRWAGGQPYWVRAG